MSLRKYTAYPHKSLAIEAALGGLIARGGGRFLRRRLHPSLAELAASSDGLHCDPRALLARANPSTNGVDGETLRKLEIEHTQVKSDLELRHRGSELPFPTAWAIETGTSLLLYALVRLIQPAHMIELGVANGESSYFILRALEANGEGRLHSFDIASEAGALITGGERAFWEFRLVDHRRTARSLLQHLSTLPRAELCFHDADHGYLAQSFEFDALWAQLTSTGILVSDDVDESYALIDFSRRRGTQPAILIDGRKAIGLMARDGA